jgi:FkbM family methyltransferase
MNTRIQARHGIHKLVVERMALPLLNILLAANHLRLPSYISIRERFQFLLSGYDTPITIVAKRFLKKGDIVADIGAHVGLVTRPLARIVGAEGRVYAFEPDPALFNLLEHNTAKLPQVGLQRLAIADSTHTAIFHLHPTSGMSNSLVNAWEGGSPIHVQCTSFDDWVGRHSIAGIRLVKIDVEGAEPLVLRGMRHALSSAHSPHIVMEFCPKNLGSTDSEEEIFEAFKTYGYTVHAIDAKGALHRLQGIGDVYRTLNCNGYVNLFAETGVK